MDLLCDICGDPIAPDEFVGLVRLGENHYVVADTRELQPGDTIDYDVYLHTRCLEIVGTRTGETLPINQG